MFEVMDLGWIDAFGGVKDWRLVMPSGYEFTTYSFYYFLFLAQYTAPPIAPRVASPPIVAPT